MFFKKKNRAKIENIEQAIAELNNGSVEAYNMLYDKYKNKVYRFCYRMLDDETSAQDAFQEVFIKIFENCKEFKGGNFTAWLFTIARHICLNYIKKRFQYDNIEEHWQIPDESIKESDFAMKDFIEQSLTKLPLAYKEALVLREYEGCSYQEIAEIMGIEVNNAKIRVHRARVIMRKILTPLVKEIYEAK